MERENIISEEEFDKLSFEEQKKEVIQLLDFLTDEELQAVYEEAKRISEE